MFKYFTFRSGPELSAFYDDQYMNLPDSKSLHVWDNILFPVIILQFLRYFADLDFIPCEYLCTQHTYTQYNSTIAISQKILASIIESEIQWSMETTFCYTYCWHEETNYYHHFSGVSRSELPKEKANSWLLSQSSALTQLLRVGCVGELSESCWVACCS